MANGLVAELLSRLNIKEVIGQRYGLRETGSELRTETHHSLVIDPVQQSFFWFGRLVNGRPAGGSVLSFLALERFHTTKFSELSKEQRSEVINEACQLANLDRKAWRASQGPHTNRAHPAGTQAPAKRKKGKWFGTITEAEDHLSGGLARIGGKLTMSWVYEARTKKGVWEPAIKVLRFDLPYDAKKKKFPKEMRPLHRVSNGWRIGLGPWGAKRWNAEKKRLEIVRRCPLYNLPAIEKRLESPLTEADILEVVEGEKCTDALKRCGLLATTSQGGAGRWMETDWSPVRRWLDAGGRVRLWPDQDAWKHACPKCEKLVPVRHEAKIYTQCDQDECAHVFSEDERAAMLAKATNTGLGYMDEIADLVLARATT